MKKLALITAIIICCALGMAAQEYLPQLKREAPDLEQIKREVNDRGSQYFYPKLMREHLSNDTTMKVDKYRHLYLGYMFQEDFYPYREAKIPAHIKELYSKSKLTRADADSILKYADIALADNPLDLYQMLYKVQAFRLKHKQAHADIWTNKIKYLVYAIMSTGNGRDELNPWWVVAPQHEYFLIQFLGYFPHKHEFNSPAYEIVTAADPYGYDTRFYFNISGILDEYYRKFE